jgi:hypothetical protein
VVPCSIATLRVRSYLTRRSVLLSTAVHQRWAKFYRVGSLDATDGYKYTLEAKKHEVALLCVPPAAATISGR